MKFSKTILFATLAVIFVTGSAGALVIQPDEATSKDNWVYEFLPTMNGQMLGYGQILSTTNTSTPHDNTSFIDFDLSGVEMSGNEVLSATLNLWVISPADAGFMYPDPSPAAAAHIDVFENDDTAWTEAGINWNNKPGSAGLVDSQWVDGIYRWVTWDVTDVVKDWLDNPDHQNGFHIFMREEDVIDPETGSKIAYTFASSGWETPGDRPFLEVTAVPEPSTIVMILGGLVAAGATVLRKKF